jgi:hypothetical protein
MAHGIGAIKAGGLAPFAERFCREGFAAVVFDYRQWGGSAGQPREELSDPRQRDDYRTALTWAAMRPDIDASQLFAWGTSFAGMYIVELAVSEPRLAGVIGQSPLVDGFAAARLGSPMRQLRLLAVTLQDRSAHETTPPPGSDIARSVRPALCVAERAPRGELHRTRGGHYDVYEGGESFEEALRVELEFLHRHAKLPAP